MKRLPGVVLVCVMALSIGACGDDSPIATEPLDEIATHEKTWSFLGFDSYSYRFRWECFCPQEFIRTVDILVVHGRIAAITDATTGDLIDKNSYTRYRTIEGLFDFVREATDSGADRVTVTYDDQLGYPVTAYVDFQEAAADEEMGFRVFELSPFR